MGVIEAELAKAMQLNAKRKGNKTEKLRNSLRAKAKAVSSGQSEVMVKVTGFSKGPGHVLSNLEYISRNGKIELENDRGEIISGKEDVRELFDSWKSDFVDGKRHKSQRDTMHLVLSMPESTDPEAVRRAAREFSKDSFGKNHEYIFALHTDEKHPHCHISVKCLGFDGKRLNPRKADLEKWRGVFAEKMIGEGVDAVATPRSVRGVVKKAEKGVVKNIVEGDKTHAPRKSIAISGRKAEAAKEVLAKAKGLPVSPKPWEAAIKEKQREVRNAWLSAADAIEKQKTVKTINQKELKNERPVYDGLDARRVQRIQQRAAVYQSNLAENGSGVPAKSIASLRDLSSINMVQHQRGSEMLLHPNARHSVGFGSSADSDMRWKGVGNTGFRESERINIPKDIAGENRALAGQIRSFVAAMPGIETEREQLKSNLNKKFTVKPEKVAEPAKSVEVESSSIKNVPKKQTKKDIER